MANMTTTSVCPYCTENIAFDHCLMNSRDSTDYVLAMHDVDEWLVPTSDSDNLAVFLDSLGAAGSVVLLERRNLHHFGRDPGAPLLKRAVFMHSAELSEDAPH